MKLYVMIGSLALLAFVAPVRAASFDMGTRTCQEWLDSDEDEQEQTIAWLRGFLSAKSGSSLYDFASVRRDASALKRYCQGHLEIGVVSAAGQMGR
jgi:HdeA/HdeB family